MKRVLYAVAPLAMASVCFFGWRGLMMLAVVNVFGFLTEYAFARAYKEPVSSSVFVTILLFALSLPPTLPFWMAAVGIVFGVTFGKMVFGGFGKNIFNPALVGRAFIYVSFPVHMNSKWVEPFAGFAGGMAGYLPDAITSATPMRECGEVALGRLLLGNTAGCLGETSALLALFGGLYIIWRKAANYRIVVSGLAGMLTFQTILWLAGAEAALDPLYALCSGGFMFGLMFFATEPVSGAQTNEGRWIYGGFIGTLTVVIRQFSGWAEGMMFAILLANMFAPIMDHGIREYKKSRKARAAK
ncbi:RnfABCDGE type electron transport complex subunit D [Candidatus Hydrogenedentota bacterium]